MKYFYKSFVQIVLFILILYALIGALLLYEANTLPHYLYHYVGKTTITADQYVSLGLGKSDGIAVLSNGPLLTYDFYSNDSYSFLRTIPITSVFDNPVLKTSVGTVYSSLRKAVIAVPIFVILLYVVYKYQRELIGWVERSRRLWWKFKYRSLPQLSPSSFLPFTYTGILGVRSWRCSSKGILTSLVQSNEWRESSFNADALPTSTNFSGAHAYRLGAPTIQNGEVMGLVEARGKYEHHPDGVVRAENCHILCLFVSDAVPKLVSWLGSKYSVPVYMACDAKQAYLGWLFSEEGMKGVKHNMGVIG